MPDEPLPDSLLAAVQRHWGFDRLRPLQAEAMRAVVQKRDSLVVLPTGGGKSLCFQAPAVALPGTTAVVSPLIALMKDQVDSLRRNGVHAVRLDSSLTAAESAAAEKAVRSGEARLVYVSPERLCNGYCQGMLRAAGVRRVAIDEAHCISHWGHDFRPEYRQLGELRDIFGDISVHAFTATATEAVRDDIAWQLNLQDPLLYVGSFDRPNLTYRVVPRLERARQVREVLDRHPDQAGIIYCLSRKEVEEIAEGLRGRGVKAVPYHAGMGNEERRRAQDAFLSEKADIVVATVAFGMGIDRPDVRFVLHVGLPKSLEHYQQEAGRAGRDGEPAECVLLYSGGDIPRIRTMIEKSAQEGGATPEFVQSAREHLEAMSRFCTGAVCRHRALVEYFNQPFEKESCGACDLCLGETAEVPDCTTVAKKILSCVARLKEGFGVGQVVAVLRGETTPAVKSRGHDKLTTYGLLADATAGDIRDWAYQLIGQGALVQSEGEYPLLKLNKRSWEVMKGERTVRLVRVPRAKKGRGERPAPTELPGLNAEQQELFQALRELRRTLASEEGVPPYIIFHDSVLHELARVRPKSTHEFGLIPKVGAAKVDRYAPAFLQVIAGWGK